MLLFGSFAVRWQNGKRRNNFHTIKFEHILSVYNDISPKYAVWRETVMYGTGNSQEPLRNTHYTCVEKYSFVRCDCRCHCRRRNSILCRYWNAVHTNGIFFPIFCWYFFVDVDHIKHIFLSSSPLTVVHTALYARRANTNTLSIWTTWVFVSWAACIGANSYTHHTSHTSQTRSQRKTKLRTQQQNKYSRITIGKCTKLRLYEKSRDVFRWFSRTIFLLKILAEKSVRKTLKPVFLIV